MQKNERKKKEGGDDGAWAWFEREMAWGDTYDMNRARQHHEESNALDDHDGMQNDKGTMQHNK